MTLSQKSETSECLQQAGSLILGKGHFPLDVYSAPQPIFLRHLLDQGDGFLGDLGLASRSLRLALPVQAKELPMPPEQGVWLHNHESLLPGSNQPGQQDEQDAIGPGDWWPFHLSFENNKLLSQEGVFCHKFGLASA